MERERDKEKEKVIQECQQNYDKNGNQYLLRENTYL